MDNLREFPLVSIGVPTYNRAKLLASMLSQLSKQTYPNLEIIISDNCSPGNDTKNVVDEIYANDGRIIYYRQDTPLVAIDNFHFVLQKSRGKYFMWAADDDERDLDFISAMVKILEDDSDCSLAYSDAAIMDNGIVVKTLCSNIKSSNEDGLMTRIENVLLNQNLNNEICGLFRKEKLLTHEFPKFYGADHAILIHAAIAGKIKKGPGGLFRLGLGGEGSTSDGVIRSFGLNRNVLNLYFGTIAQSVGLFKFIKQMVRPNIFQTAFILYILLRRVFFVKVYRDDLIIDSFRFIKKVLSWGRYFLTSLPRRIKNRIVEFIDFLRVVFRTIKNIRNINTPSSIKNNILLVSLEGMNHFMPVLWGVFGRGLSYYGYKMTAVSLSRSIRNNWLYKLFGIRVICFDKLSEVNEIEQANLREMKNSFLVNVHTLTQTLQFTWLGMPLGKYAVSTYCRNYKTGEADITNYAVKDEIAQIIERIYVNYIKAKKLFVDNNIDKAFFTELNTDSYGGFYLAAIELDRDIIRWASSSRDNVFFLQHFDKKFNSWHHSALAPDTWKKIKQEKFEHNQELETFFAKRYGGAWAVFSRNYSGTKEVSSDEIREWLGFQQDEKVAIVFSHILYDTLYFYGKDIFDSYAEWLIETVKSACDNPNVKWLIKIHPSNIWRGEKGPGEYEEELLIAKHIGKLPSHVRLIPPGTPFSPISWMKFADFGITVRGTTGMEMATMGKAVITAGRGRYDRSGFTYDPNNISEYKTLLASLPKLEALSDEQIFLARQYMHAVFIRKAFPVTVLEPILATGKKKLTLLNDSLLVPANSLRYIKPSEWEDIKVLADWLNNREEKDYLSPWNKI